MTIVKSTRRARPLQDIHAVPEGAKWLVVTPIRIIFTATREEAREAARQLYGAYKTARENGK